MTKQGIVRNFDFGKGKIGEIESKNSFGNGGGKSETGGNASLPQRGWTPLLMSAME